MRISKCLKLFVICLGMGVCACGFDDTDPLWMDDRPRDPFDFGHWQQLWREMEEDVVDAVNQQRALGGDCGTRGLFDPAPPLTMNEQLTTAARWHSQDMAQRGFFDHTSPPPDATTPAVRVSQAGYDWQMVGENIAAGYMTVQSVMRGWMNSDGHCANILSPRFVELGVGVYESPDQGDRYRTYWTQKFGRPQ